jgi:hypothetical protein
LWLVVKAVSNETGLIGKAIVDGENLGIYSCNIESRYALVDGDEASSILIGRWPAVSGGARVSSYDLTIVLSAAPYLRLPGVMGTRAAVTQHQGVRTMRLNRNTDGNKRGAANRRNPRRRYRRAAAPRDAVPIEKMSMLQRLRYASDYFFWLAERERKKGDRGDVTVIVALMQAGAMIAAKAAPYIHPKVAAMQFEGSQSQPQRTKVDLSKLTDDELDALERLMTKAAVPDEGQQPVPSDEYLPSDKSSA